jgi:hypothetical protein
VARPPALCFYFDFWWPASKTKSQAIGNAHNAAESSHVSFHDTPWRHSEADIGFSALYFQDYRHGETATQCSFT